MKTPRELEKLINESPLFRIDRIKDKELFIVEERRFLADLAELLSLTRKDFCKIGYEIVLSAKACIKSYKVECGAFLNYFNTALKKTISAQKAKEEISDTRSGITLEQKTDQIIRYIAKYEKICGEEPDESRFVNRIADVLNITPEKAFEAIAINRDIYVQSGSVPIMEKDGKKGELFDLIADKTSSPNDVLTDEAAVKTYLQTIDAAFQKQQDRLKPILSKLLTAQVLKALGDIRLIEKVISGVSFINRQIFEGYKENRTVPTAREIAESCGVREESASRTINTFIKKIRKNS
ncbi:MAG: hypothetical protein LBC76_01690 [Treponema sp.]|jgi:DNA-directed RNA polymerase specialized sigma subunit|nr:hypothetical protein [Treponema sp.]